jgi:hypothetical protein
LLLRQPATAASNTFDVKGAAERNLHYVRSSPDADRMPSPFENSR